MRMSTKCRAFFDTVNMYSNGGSEEIVGSALKDFTNRDSVVIATKRRGMEPCRDVLEARLIRALSPPAIAIGKSRLRGISPFAGAAWTGRCTRVPVHLFPDRNLSLRIPGGKQEEVFPSSRRGMHLLLEERPCRKRRTDHFLLRTPGVLLLLSLQSPPLTRT